MIAPPLFRAVVRLALCLAVIALVSPVRAQVPVADPAPTLAALKGDYFSLASSAVGRSFHIYVRYPEGYDPGEARLYPTVYLTDGDSLFPMLAPVHLFLTYEEDLPEAILVGIAYGGFDPSVNRRNIDFQSPGDGVADEAAGAEAFQRFLKVELIPEIERRYRSDPRQRVLFGQSRGGAFVLYSAVSDPDLFRGRIASNPSITPGIESLIGEAAPTTRTDLGLVVTSGTRDRPDLQQEAALFLSTWEGRTRRPWALHGIRIPDGTHAASAPEAYRAGMLRLFGGERSP